MRLKITYTGVFGILLILLIGFPGLIQADEKEPPLKLQQIIQMVLDANLEIRKSNQATEAALAQKKQSRSYFLPTFNATYQYKRIEEEISTTFEIPALGIEEETIISPEEEYTFMASVTQPLFTGFSILNQYKMAELGIDLSKTKEKLVRQDVILEATNAYFSVLKAEKLLNVSQETVTQISAQEDVVDNFYQVGMSPLNDLLEVQVLLANAKQDVIIARNNLEAAKSYLNILLRRPMHQPIEIVDVLDYTPFKFDLSYCLQTAEDNRIEIKLSDLEIRMAQKDLDLAKKDYYPMVNLQGTYYRFGTEWDVDGGEGIEDESTWDVRLVATWDFWEWGQTSYGAQAKRSALSQAQLSRSQLKDNIHLEVKQAFLAMGAAEKNIQTVETAIEQAQENVRISEERYKEQVATSTDVLTAQTLLSRTMTNYYNALYNFKIAKATLYRKMGQLETPE